MEFIKNRVNYFSKYIVFVINWEIWGKKIFKIKRSYANIVTFSKALIKMSLKIFFQSFW